MANLKKKNKYGISLLLFPKSQNKVKCIKKRKGQTRMETWSITS